MAMTITRAKVATAISLVEIFPLSKFNLMRHACSLNRGMFMREAWKMLFLVPYAVPRWSCLYCPKQLTKKMYTKSPLPKGMGLYPANMISSEKGACERIHTMMMKGRG